MIVDDDTIVILSYEDVQWVEAIAQRAVLLQDWTYNDAYAQALIEVEQFCRDQLAVDGRLQHGCEITLCLARILYEKETVERVAERQREIEEVKAAAERRRTWARQEQLRTAKHVLMAPQFLEAGGRSRWVYIQYQRGRTLAAIAELIGLSVERVRQIRQAEERREKWRWRRLLLRMKHKHYRPLDMGGGPRDVWLTFLPPVDPRDDNIYLEGDSDLAAAGRGSP